MSLSSEDESDVSSCSDSGESTDSSDEEISIGTIPLQRSESVKCAVEQPMVQEEDEDTIVVDDLDIETEGNVPSRISQHFGGFTSNIPIADNAVIPVPMYQKGNVKHKNPGDKRVINSVSKSALSSPAPLKKSLVVKLKLPKLRQLKPHRSLIVKLQLPTGTNMKKRPMPFEDRQPASKSHRKMCLPEATAMKHELSASSEVQQSNKSLSHHQQAAQMKLEAEKLFARGDDHQGRAIAMLTHSLFHQILHFCDLERNKEELEVVCDFASKIRVFIEDVIEKHVSFGNLGIAGLLMKVESILTFRALNLQSHLIKAKTAEMKSQNLKISGNYLNTVHKFTDDFQSVTKKWQDAECFLSRDAILVPAARDSLSLFTPLSHIVEVSKTAVPL
ncbi:hypothetical protein K493DRAFT_14855 [Basidiobolus meristosporus CBS 931.73]|uniref:Uncharacterized protein n=1 Tax=Basidiobolus meristosporus CBS 931.73 TaxID=1314790 RepID=A0A1Y1YH90_9FUNG|nr:hypothetical protein K493DRAFT_14855 [Basidiobolus meristosporus CBS 931.73]|eukprot:ORX97318.1 hypothetical protein K493DRAFT_14855 [Basidiobolus meristosporus CBS 931.73]